MKSLNKLIAAILIAGTTTFNVYAADNSSHLQEVQTLFKLTQMEKKVDQSIDSIMQLQLSQNPHLAQRKPEIRAFFEKYIGWTALKDDIAGMYMQKFSEDELKAINNFYITPVGQKVINELPGLVQQRNQLAMMRLQENIGELHQIIGTPQQGK